MRKLSGLFLFAVLISGMFSSSFAFAQVGPIAEDDFYSVDEDSLLTVNPIGVLLNDTNTQSDTFLSIIKTDVGFGILTLNSDVPDAWKGEMAICTLFKEKRRMEVAISPSP